MVSKGKYCFAVYMSVPRERRRWEERADPQGLYRLLAFVSPRTGPQHSHAWLRGRASPLEHALHNCLAFAWKPANRRDDPRPG